LGIQPVGREHHEDEMWVELLLLLFHTAQVFVVGFHACGRQSRSLQDTEKNYRFIHIEDVKIRLQWNRILALIGVVSCNFYRRIL